jgi:hypothetical protein
MEIIWNNIGYISIYMGIIWNNIWLVVSIYPSEKWSSSVGMMKFPIYGKMFQTTDQIMILTMYIRKEIQ